MTVKRRPARLRLPTRELVLLRVMVAAPRTARFRVRIVADPLSVMSPVVNTVKVLVPPSSLEPPPMVMFLQERLKSEPFVSQVAFVPHSQVSDT